MDANKLEKLKEIDYHIPKTCGLCVHSSFFSDLEEWGECKNITYEHLKHSKNPRQLSIYRGGVCSQFVADPTAEHLLGKFAEFVR